MSGFMSCHFFTEAVFMIAVFLTEIPLDFLQFYVGGKTLCRNGEEQPLFFLGRLRLNQRMAQGLRIPRNEIRKLSRFVFLDSLS